MQAEREKEARQREQEERKRQEEEERRRKEEESDRRRKEEDDRRRREEDERRKREDDDRRRKEDEDRRRREDDARRRDRQAAASAKVCCSSAGIYNCYYLCLVNRFYYKTVNFVGLQSNRGKSPPVPAMRTKTVDLVRFLNTKLHAQLFC